MTHQLSELLEILSYRRPNDSYTMRKVARDYLVPLGAHRDRFGNYRLQIGDAPTVLWSAHLDSVHRIPGQQRIKIVNNIVHAMPNRKGKYPNCLGADDAAGIWILMEMARARVPGLYVWHYGEEVGGIGSSAISKHDAGVLKDIKIAIAFDRRGTDSIITHQWYGRCCSIAFSGSLITELERLEFPGFVRDDGGTFTDTANYVDQIPECTNVSVGYANEHRANESLDLNHVERLRDAFCQIDTANLVIERDPSVYDEYDDFGYYFRGSRSTIWDRPTTTHFIGDPHKMGPLGRSDIHGLVPERDKPRLISRVWARQDGDIEYHQMDDYSVRSGLASCGARIDDPISYWSTTSSFVPYFCDDCMAIDDDLYREFITRNGKTTETEYLEVEE